MFANSAIACFFYNIRGSQRVSGVIRVVGAQDINFTDLYPGAVAKLFSNNTAFHPGDKIQAVFGKYGCDWFNKILRFLAR